MARSPYHPREQEARQPDTERDQERGGGAWEIYLGVVVVVVVDVDIDVGFVVT